VAANDRRDHSTKVRAYVALREGLIAMLSPERSELVDGSGRTASFEDNLLHSLTSEQVKILREQLSSGDGYELTRGPDGRRPDAYAAHSSSALAFNAFGAWLGHEPQLVVGGITGFANQLRVEARQRIFRGGRAPNLDCLLVGQDVVMGIESKLTEPLSRHTPKTWSDAYGRESCRKLLDGGWLRALDDARAGRYRTVYLDVNQLLKHALGLSKQHPNRERHLAYIFWEPHHAEDLNEIQSHRAEVADLLDRVGDASPRLHAFTYSDLWVQWETLSSVPWLATHLAALRARYAVPLPSGG
jgi:hypothetical protein